MKVAIYTPYLDSFGGGERYMLTIAEGLSQGNEVDVLLDKHLFSLGPDKLKLDLSKRLNINLTKVKFILSPLGSGGGGIKRLQFLKQYDLLFYLTDGSIFYSTAKKNILHLQSPLSNLKLSSPMNKLKLTSWDLIIYNSWFTKQHAEKYWHAKGVVIYPPVDIENITVLPKKKYILSVGRFFGFLKSKKHEEMIDSFARMYRTKQIGGWSLHLAGSASSGDETYVETLKNRSKGLPVYFYPNLNFDKLVTLYGEATIYWHAAGFGETDPTKMEHFGISTVEAMAGGCVPIVINLGGQTEIIENGRNGLLWNSPDELIENTVKVIGDKELSHRLSRQARFDSQKFSKQAFINAIKKLAYEKV